MLNKISKVLSKIWDLYKEVVIIVVTVDLGLSAVVIIVDLI